MSEFKIKSFTQFVNEQKVNEISSELRNNAISTMKDRGMNNRAERWTQFYVDRDLKEFVGKDILGGKGENTIIIQGFIMNDKKGSEGEMLKSLHIICGSPRSQLYNTTHLTLVYDFQRDKYLSMNYPIDRKTGRMLSKIATIMNSESQYSNGRGEFKFKDE
jgi:hypothetical protein